MGRRGGASSTQRQRRQQTMSLRPGRIHTQIPPLPPGATERLLRSLFKLLNLKIKPVNYLPSSTVIYEARSVSVESQITGHVLLGHLASGSSETISLHM